MKLSNTNTIPLLSGRGVTLGILLVLIILGLTAVKSRHIGNDAAESRLADLPAKMKISVKSQIRANTVYRDEELPGENTSHTGNMAVLVIYPEIVKLHQIEQLATDPEEALAGLQPMLFSSDPKVRLAALESVAELKSPNTLPILIEALNDYLPSIRKTSTRQTTPACWSPACSISRTTGRAAS